LDKKSPGSLKSPKPLNSLKQLHGIYEIMSANRKVKVSEEKIVKEGKVCNLVYCVLENDEAIPYQLLWEEDNHFNICSMDGCFKATILKGSNVQSCVTWVRKDGVNKVIWVRSKDQTCDSSRISTASSSRFTPESDNFTNGLQSFKSNNAGSSESSRCHFNERNENLNTEFARLDYFDSTHLHSTSRRNNRSSAEELKIRIQNNAIFELIKAQCNSNSWLMEKVIEYGVSHGSKSSRITKENAQKLSHGRL